LIYFGIMSRGNFKTNSCYKYARTRRGSVGVGRVLAFQPRKAILRNNLGQVVNLHAHMCSGQLSLSSSYGVD
jgi:hypothetical protein